MMHGHRCKLGLLYRRYRLALLLALCGVLSVEVRASAGGEGSVQDDGPAQVEGKLGTVYPEPGDVRLLDVPVHQDTYGGNNQLLLAICGAGGSGGSRGRGFATVWRDQRDGMLGLYLARLDAKGSRREPEQTFHAPHAGRRRDPALALQADSSGAIVWVSEVARHPVPWLRAFDAEGKLLGGDRALVTIPEGLAPQSARESGARQPAIAARQPSGFFIAWTESGKAKLLTADAAGEPNGEPLELPGPRAEPGVVLAANARGVLCLWKSGADTFALDCMRPRSAPIACGSGTLVRVAANPAGGFWALFQDGDRAVLRHLSDVGRPERDALHPLEAAVTALDLAVSERGLTILAELGATPDPAAGPAAERGRGGRAAAPAPRDDARAAFRLIQLDRNGRAAEGGGVEFLPAEARGVSGPRIAADANGFLVAWTEVRERNDPDVFARAFDPSAAAEDRLGPVVRLNSDAVSADQGSAFVAGAGEHGVVAWQDRRDGFPQVYARRFGPSGFQGDEFRLPAAFGDEKPSAEQDPCSAPSVAVRANGDFVVFWHQQREQRAWLRAQAFRADGNALAGPVALEEAAASATLAHAVTALADEDGWLALYARSQNSLVARRITPRGALAGEARAVSMSRELVLGNPALALLDDGRSIAAWDAAPTTEGGSWTLRGRFLDHEGAPVGREIEFAASPAQQDWDPALAPLGREGGRNAFVIAWTTGPPDGGQRDILARAYDARATPAGPILWISVWMNEQDFPELARLADGSVAVAWEDDVSGYDHALVRRISATGRELGPIMRIHQLETKAVEDRGTPVLAPLGGGWAAAWGDRRRSQGWDVYLRTVGPKFDAALKR